MKIDFDELGALDAAGALTEDEQLDFQRALDDAPADVRTRVAAFGDVMRSLAEAGSDAAPRPAVRDRLLASIVEQSLPAPQGFSFRFASEDDWRPHPVPGIKMKVLAMNRERNYVTLLLDVAPGSRFPPHHHGGAEECYVVSGSVYACGRRLEAGDFHHADAGSDHGELWTEEGCRVLLVVSPDDYLPAR